MEKMVAALICLPFLWAIIPAVIHKSKVRRATVYVGGALVTVLSICTCVMWYRNGGEAIVFDLPYVEVFDKLILVGDFLLMGLVIYQCIKHKKTVISLLSIVQTLLVA